MKRKLLFLFIVILICPDIALSATYYVSSSGSASWANSTNINTPCSVSTAMSNAVADDVVYFRGGTYNVGACSSEGYSATLEPTNQGTSGHPITFQAYTGETPIINATAVPSGWATNYNIGTGNRSYIVWDGFTVTASNNYHGAVYIGGDAGGSTGSVIRNCTIGGGSYVNSGTDNVPLVRFTNATNCTVENCLIYNNTNSSNYHNTCGVQAYDSSGLVLKNCELYNITNAVYWKRNNQNVTMYNNYIHDNYHGMWIAVYSGNYSDGFNIYNNVIVNNDGGSIYVEADDSGCHASNYNFYNNTIYNNNADVLSIGNAIAWNIYNNVLFALGSQYGFKTIWSNSSYVTHDHNNWGSTRFSVRIHEYASSTTYSSLGTWQSSGTLSGGGNPGTGDRQDSTSSLFVNGSGNLNTLSDFEIQGSSLTAGRSSGIIGADISTVGVDARESGDTTPPTLSNLSQSGAQSCTSDPLNVTESLTTNEPATCRAHDTATTWAGMTEMSTTGGTSHSRTVSRACGASYSPNVICRDATGNESAMSEWGYFVGNQNIVGATLAGSSLH